MTIERGRFTQVHCQETNNRARICGSYLGDIQIDKPNITRKYCRACKRLEQWEVDDDGRVVVTEIPKEKRLKYYTPTAIVREL